MMMKCYLVGGAVRDQLLNLPVTERDWVVVGASIDEMLSQGYIQVGKEFPVFLHPETHEEYALARTERKTGHGYKGFVTFASPEVTLEDDLSRRDLTINAIVLNEDKQLIDPFHGIDDLNNRCLRHISSAFIEDPLRVLRVARFAARFADLGFSIAPETLTLMQEISKSGELLHLTPERTWQECSKALQTSKPSVFFKTLETCGALNQVFPEIHKLFNPPQYERSPAEANDGIPALSALDHSAGLSTDCEVRFAALTHNLDIKQTRPQLPPSCSNDKSKSIELINQMATRLKIPTKFSDLAILVTRCYSDYHRIFSLDAKAILALLLTTDAFRRPKRFQQFLIACTAIFQSYSKAERNMVIQKNPLENILSACQTLEIKSIINNNMSNDEKATAIEQARLAVINRVISTHS